jgi:ABC-2 type transport system permease protein
MFRASRALAIVERDLRRLRRSRPLLLVSMLFPIVQFVVLGFTLGGDVRHLKVALVDDDHGVWAGRLRATCRDVAVRAGTFVVADYENAPTALMDLRAGRVHAVLTIPSGFSHRIGASDHPRVRIIQDRTDAVVAAGLATAFTAIMSEYSPEQRQPLAASSLLHVEIDDLYAPVRYIQYLFPGSIVMAMFVMVMIGGGVTFIDDKARGLHEGYLVTPVTKIELIAGFVWSGVMRALLAGGVLMVIGSAIAGVRWPLDPVRLSLLAGTAIVTACALMTMMFLLMVRVNDPLLPRAMFGALSTVLFFPSGAVYPPEAFPGWMRAFAAVNPFTYAVHAFRTLLIKGGSAGDIASDLGFLTIFSLVALTAATALFRRSL